MKGNEYNRLVRAGGKMSVGCQPPEKKEDAVQKEEVTPTDKTEDEGCPVGMEELLLEELYLNVKPSGQCR